MKRIALAVLLCAGPAFAQEPTPALTPSDALEVLPSPSPSPAPAAAKIEVNIVGAVTRPGRYSVVKEAGVVGAIAAAGWFIDTGDQKKVKVIRRGGSPADKPSIIIVNVAAITNGEKQDLMLEPEDIITIGQKMVNF